MTRTYTMKRRAEQQADTRRKIVEAAVELHSSVGPVRTTVSMVAERAGVQRHTFYAHFPDERSLIQACSGLTLERDPPPDAAPWRAIADRHRRLRAGLGAVYAWYERNAELTACVLRDAEISPLIKENLTSLWGPYFAAHHEVLGETLGAKQRAMLHLALSFFTWRTLVRESGLTPAAAIEAMLQAIEGAG